MLLLLADVGGYYNRHEPLLPHWAVGTIIVGCLLAALVLYRSD